MVQPGDSAIFALLRTLDPDLVAAQFKGYGGTILRTTLNPQRARRSKRRCTAGNVTPKTGTERTAEHEHPEEPTIAFIT